MAVALARIATALSPRNSPIPPRTPTSPTKPSSLCETTEAVLAVAMHVHSPSPLPAVPVPTAPHFSTADELIKLAHLRSDGILSTAASRNLARRVAPWPVCAYIW